MIVRDSAEILGWSFDGHPSTTNNLMEAEAAIQGMKAAIHLGFDGKEEFIEIVSDSQYVIGIGLGTYKPSKNLDTAKKLKELAAKLRVGFRWIKGHTGNKYNEICDKLAKRGKMKLCPISQSKARKKANKKTQKQKRRALIHEENQKRINGSE